VAHTPTVQASSAEKVLDAACRRGADRAALLDAAGLDPATVRDAEARIPYRALARLYELAAERTGDAAFGLHAGDESHPRMFDVMGAVALRSVTLRAAFDRILRFYRVLQEGAALELDVAGDTASVRYTVVEPLPPGWRHEVEATLAIVHRWLRVALGRDVVPSFVWFTHAGPPAAARAEHRRVFGRAPRWGAAANRLAFAAALLDEPLVDADPSLAPILERMLAGMLERMPRAGFVDGVRARVAARLRAGAPAAPVARDLGVSERTLQRRLAGEGLSYRDLVDDVRRLLAVDSLAAGAEIREVASALGYRDATTFHRAFRRWTGSTPGAARRAGRR
jgi:AraC-like DNA-binding protein